MVNMFVKWVTSLQARLHAFPAPWRRCSSLQNAVCSVVTPSQKAGKTHTRTCPTAVSRLMFHPYDTATGTLLLGALLTLVLLALLHFVIL